MSFFHFLPGANALSSFRQQRLLASLADQGIKLDSIEAQYLHFIWSTVALSSHDQEILASLLTYGEPFTGTASKKVLWSFRDWEQFLPGLVKQQILPGNVD